jgi:hypothetical protein
MAVLESRCETLPPVPRSPVCSSLPGSVGENPFRTALARLAEEDSESERGNVRTGAQDRSVGIDCRLSGSGRKSVRSFQQWEAEVIARGRTLFKAGGYRSTPEGGSF